MSAGQTFAEQARPVIERIERQRTAIEAIEAIDTAAAGQPMRAQDRQRGGVSFDPVDPTMIVVPVEWLAALLDHARNEGRRSLTRSEEFRSLLQSYDALRQTARWEQFEQDNPIATALRRFAESL